MTEIELNELDGALVIRGDYEGQPELYLPEQGEDEEATPVTLLLAKLAVAWSDQDIWDLIEEKFDKVMKEKDEKQKVSQDSSQ